MFKATVAFISGGIIGKLLAVPRELLMASLFGTSMIASAYRIAESALLIPVNFFISDMLNAVFIPLFQRYSGEDKNRAQRLFLALLAIFMIIAVMLTVTLLWKAPSWVHTLAPGFDAESGNLAILFVRVLALGTIFYILSVLFSYRELVDGGYKLTSTRAGIQSLGLIAGTLTAFWTGRSVFLAWGFVGAYFLQSLWGGLLLFRRKLLFLPSGGIFCESRLMVNDSWRILKPLLALPLLMQGGFVVERAIASLIGVRVVASVDYAKFITETGMALLAIPLGLAGLSAWSGLDPDALKERLQKIVPFILIVTVPFSSFLLFHNHLLVKVLYARGAFDAESTTITASVLAGLAAGFWAQVAGYVLIKALNSQLRNREVVLFVAAALSANILVIVSLFKVLGPLALGLGASVNGVILLFLTTRVFSLSKKIIPVIVWLGAGAVPYSFVAFRIAGDTKIAMAAALLLFCIYWGLFIFAIPLLRSSFFQVLARFIKKP